MLICVRIDVELYNLMIMDTDLKIVSHGKDFVCYYPESYMIPLESRESVISIDEDKVYINKWVEEGYDKDSNSFTNQYHYHEKLIIKDFSGNILSEKIGYLNSYLDDELWLS
ncbi:hypothetical protein ACMGE9_08440 [Macrococcus sp. EM39E]|uniref:hypothetical protein n=1 Tax=Macrococcus animalis TaxID=3395467 RepID=UPI0039BDDC6E